MPPGYHSRLIDYTTGMYNWQMQSTITAGATANSAVEDLVDDYLGGSHSEAMDVIMEQSGNTLGFGSDAADLAADLAAFQAAQDAGDEAVETTASINTTASLGVSMAAGDGWTAATSGSINLGAGSVSAGAQITKTGCKGVIGADYINLANITVTPAITAGVSGTFEITVDSVTGLAAGQRVEGQGIPAQTRVVGISGTQVYLDKALTAASGGNATFHVEVAKELTAGMVVSQTATPNGIAASTTIVGIDYTTYTGEIGPRVYLSNQLIDNIQVTNGNDAVLFDFAVITTDPGGTATPHGLNPGDVIYIAQGTGGAHVAAHYTVFETPSDTTITTSPALGGNVGKATLYSSIFFAERFTNGPYAIQNNGDQIKVTLNVSLD